MAPGVAEAHPGLDPTLAACLDGRDGPEAEAVWYEWAEAVQPLNEELERVERALASESGVRLQQLQSLFRLSAPEIDLLQTCLAPVNIVLNPNSCCRLCARMDLTLTCDNT